VGGGGGAIREIWVGAVGSFLAVARFVGPCRLFCGTLSVAGELWSVAID
jgi:hypothetical protein